MLSKLMKKYIRPLFVIYSIIMLWLLFGQRLQHLDFTDYYDKLSLNINLVPFDTVKLFWNAAKGGRFYWIWQAVRNISGNVVLFIPLGALSLLNKRLQKFLPFILTVTVIISAVELLQFFTLLGSLDIDDLILNLCGATVGYLLCKPLQKALSVG